MAVPRTGFRALGGGRLGGSGRRGQAVEQDLPESGPEFLEGIAMTGDRQNPFQPQPAPHRRDRVREGHVALARPVHHADPRPRPGNSA